MTEREFWGDDDERVRVSKRALKLLYECAKSYDTRIPADAHFGWAVPFHEMFGGNPVPERESRERRRPG